jgi:hypothetical protein
MATFDCEKPLRNRRTTIAASDRANPVSRRHPAITAKLVSRIGRRPNRSDKAPRMGAPIKLAAPKLQATTPYQNALSAFDAANVPTSDGSTGMITPTAIMSISTAIRMKKIVAVGRWRVIWRPRR